MHTVREVIAVLNSWKSDDLSEFLRRYTCFGPELEVDYLASCISDCGYSFNWELSIWVHSKSNELMSPGYPSLRSVYDYETAIDSDEDVVIIDLTGFKSL